MPFITKDNAARLAKLSVLARVRNKHELANPCSIPLDPFSTALVRACDETLDELRSCKIARDKSALARTIRDLRETYHLATGQAKPGVIKHQAQRPRPVPSTPIVLPQEPEPQ